jgi:hypothetical protein
MDTLQSYMYSFGYSVTYMYCICVASDTNTDTTVQKAITVQNKICHYIFNANFTVTKFRRLNFYLRHNKTFVALAEFLLIDIIMKDF